MQIGWLVMYTVKMDENRCKNVFQGNWEKLCYLPPFVHLVKLHSISSCALFQCFDFVSFVTTTIHILRFKSQGSLFLISVTVLHRLKFKYYAIFIEWGSKGNFMSWKDKTLSTSFPFRFSKNFLKMFLVKSFLRWFDRRDKFEKTSQQD